MPDVETENDQDQRLSVHQRDDVGTPTDQRVSEEAYELMTWLIVLENKIDAGQSGMSGEHHAVDG